MRQSLLLLITIIGFLHSSSFAQLSLNTINLKEVSWTEPSQESSGGVYQTNQTILTFRCKVQSDANLDNSDFTLFVDGESLVLYNAICKNNELTFTAKLSLEKDHEVYVSVRKGRRVIQTPLLKIVRYKAVKRFAFLLGNSDYVNTPSLKNRPLEDINAIATSLKELDFTIHSVSNLSRIGLLDSLDNFVAEAHHADMIFFYYAGHGIQNSGKNYLVPVDAKFRTRTDIAPRAVEIQYIINKLEESNPKCKIIVLDACRNEAFPVLSADSRGDELRGFSPIMGVSVAKGVGTYIVNATQANQTAANDGIFAKELASALGRGKTISEVFRKVRTKIVELSGSHQEPEINDKLTEEITF